jgi:soluble lytic murein transglycosylase-like protein
MARTGVSPLITVLAGVAAVCAASSARAQVLEIGADGSVATYVGPLSRTGEGVRAITSPPRQRSEPPTGPADLSELHHEIAAAAARHAIDPRLAEAVAWRESGMRQGALSPKGAVGVMQLMPSTARALGVDAARRADNIEGGVAYLAALLQRFGGDLILSLAAYNAGPGAVDAHRGVPPYQETRNFVSAVLDRLAADSVGPARGGAP